MTRYLGPKTDPANVATQSDLGGSALSDDTPDALTPDQAGAAGTATAAARADHQHEITAGAAGTILPDATAAEGSSTSFSRADHTHAIVAAAPSSNLTATTTNSEGSSTSFSRADHSHAITTGEPVIQFGVTNAEGNSTGLARANHTHAISAPRAKGSRSTNINFTSSNTPTTVSLTTQDIAIGASVNTSSNWVSPDSAGDYLISGYCEWASNASGRRELGYQINSGGTNLIATLHCSSNTVHRLNFTDLVTLAAGDEVSLRALQNSTSTLALQAAAISIVRVG